MDTTLRTRCAGGMGTMDGVGEVNTHMGDSPMSMPMVFFSATDTPLLTNTLTPRSIGEYAGLCILLVVLSIITRCLLAIQTIFKKHIAEMGCKRRYTCMQDQPSEAQKIPVDEELKEERFIKSRVLEEKVEVLVAKNRSPPAWRFRTDVPRALIVTVTSALGYLLMLAVMTFNLGYFFSVLGGLLVGDLLIGRFVEGHNDH